MTKPQNNSDRDKILGVRLDYSVHPMPGVRIVSGDKLAGDELTIFRVQWVNHNFGGQEAQQEEEKNKLIMAEEAKLD